MSSKPQRSSSGTTRSPASSNVYSRPAASKASNSFFSTNSHRGASSSYYKRRSRDGFLARLVDKIKRMLRDLYRYVREHPTKVLLPLAMALISGGALTALARKVGIKLPASLENVLGGGAKRGGFDDAFYGSQHGGGMDTGGMLKGAMKVASAFM